MQRLASRLKSAAGAGYDVSGGPGDIIIDEEIEIGRRGRNGKNGKKVDRLPAAAAAELSKSFNGEKIGIGMADLFYMVHKNYGDKKKAKAFFDREY